MRMGKDVILYKNSTTDSSPQPAGKVVGVWRNSQSSLQSMCVWCLTWELFPSPASPRTSVSLLAFLYKPPLRQQLKNKETCWSRLWNCSRALACASCQSSSAWVSCGTLSVVSPRAQLPSPADLMSLSTLLASPGTASGTSKLHFPRLVCRVGLTWAINTQRSLI